MSHPCQTSPSTFSRRPTRRLHPAVWTLEDRLLLCTCELANSLAIAPAWISSPTVDVAEVAETDSSSATRAASVTSPLTAVPALNSLLGARVSLYLDFNGDSTSSYGGYNSIVTPAYDQDDDPTSFSAAELASIHSIWSYVSEDYAPFNVNVTTVQPASLANGTTLKVVIGGKGAWTGGLSGGLSYINAFTSLSIPSVSFVFSDNLAGGNARFTGDAASHEAGHGFGLSHQSRWSGTTKVAEYCTGSGDGTAPLMGSSYAAQRSLWSNGTSGISSTTYQDDMAIIAGSRNGFGYRPARASSLAAPIALAVQDDGKISASGLLVSTSQVDYYSFTSVTGSVSFTVTPPASVANLAPIVSILNASGTAIATAGPGSNLTATVTANLPAGGTYRLAVTSSGGYGNVGNYSLSGAVATSSTPSSSTGSDVTSDGSSTPVIPNAPASLVVVAASYNRIDLAWSIVAGATGYLVERSLDGVNWTAVAGVGAGVTTFADVSVAPGTAYAYHVRSLSNGVSSAPSMPVVTSTAAIPTPPPAVSSFYLISRSARQVVVGWLPNPTTSTHGYVVERSTNGRVWTTMARVYGDASTFTDSTVAPKKTYMYRIRAFNAWGTSNPSSLVRVMTPRAMVVAFARRRVR